MQTNVENKAEFEGISHERCVYSYTEQMKSLGRSANERVWNRAFADYVFGSMILHFFCVNFIN